MEVFRFRARHLTSARKQDRSEADLPFGRRAWGACRSAPRRRYPFVIPGAKANAPRADLKYPWRSITKAAGLEGVRLHDLRHSFACVGAGASLGLPIIGKPLGHSQSATTGRYAHLDADPMRRAVYTIGATISAAMHRKPEHDNAIPLKGSRDG